MAIEVCQADITTLDVDAVVNAANAALAPGGGVCGAIFAAAGPSLVPACRAIGHCEPGDAVITPGFALPARWIVHTVGPVWHGGDHGEADVLASCYRRSLEVAADHGVTSIAFPAIATGIFGYPPDAAATIAVDTVRSAPVTVDRVLLVAYDPATQERYRNRLSSPAGP
jgi:O-acetyl-ADP-ribose deacetylase (regulator of RNase III)